MITTRFYLCALPGALWKEEESWNDQIPNIRSFVEDALGIERRIQKGVNQDNERVRYNLCCTRIESAVSLEILTSAANAEQFRSTLKAHRLPASALEAGYLDVLTSVLKLASHKGLEMRLGASFFPPQMVEAHTSAFYQFTKEMGMADHVDVRRRIAFFQLAQQFKCGVVELQNAFQFIPAAESARLTNVRGDGDISQGQSLADIEEATYNEGRDLYDILREQIQNAINAAREGRAGAVNFSNQPHNVITEVLNEFVYKDSNDTNEPVYIQVVYTDGSQGEPFPLRCLPLRAETDLIALRRLKPLRVALMSMRHLEMDRDVDMAWFRNQEVSKSRTFAETDSFCYLQTRNQLRETRAEGSLRLYLYQTGLQPAVIGFYRALVEELLFRGDSSSLEIVPYYYCQTGYLAGQPWI